jgi:hypothetical protein
MLTSCYHKAGEKRSIKITNRSYEDVEKLKYFGKNANIEIPCMKRLRAD